MIVFGLTDMVAAIENTSDSVQLFLKNALRNILYKARGPIELVGCAELDAIISCEILNEIDGKYDVSISAKKNARKLYTYLVRKFDTDIYLDPETCQEVAIPKGATFMCSMSVDDGASSLALQFPDDEVTELLDLFGSNPCKNWNLE